MSSTRLVTVCQLRPTGLSKSSIIEQKSHKASLLIPYLYFKCRIEFVCSTSVPEMVPTKFGIHLLHISAWLVLNMADTTAIDTAFIDMTCFSRTLKHFSIQFLLNCNISYNNLQNLIIHSYVSSIIDLLTIVSWLLRS